MEGMFNLSPVQYIFVLALNVWIFIIFPILVLRKLKYMTDILEAQYYEDHPEDGETRD